ncbi:MAG: glycosyltransferase family 2 protein [Alphaproteobacteria bacterium]|nr:glycosyltransferase family 2 protein [Alphaproteobacteria bacterium]
MAAAAPWVSVIIPTHNHSTPLLRALESVSSQGDQGVEVVVVDDGSTDDTAARLQSMRSSFPLPLVVVHQENRGPSAARNAGVRAASGAYLYFLDADDRLFPGALNRFKAELARRPVDMVFGGRIEHTHDRTRLTSPPPLTGQRARDFADYVTRARPTIAQGCAVFARRVFDRLSWPEELRIAEDLVVHAQALALFDAACFPDPVAEIGEDGAKSMRRGLERWQDLLATVDRIFDPSLLPPEMMGWKPTYEGLTHLTLFRLFQRAGDGAHALRHYRRALRLVPRRALRPRYVGRALTAMLAAMTRRSPA